MLIALVTGQRCQTIHLMDLGSMHKNADHNNFVVRELVKLILPALKEDYRFCVYSVLIEYIKRALPHRGGVIRLFLSFASKPFQALSKDTFHVGLRLS